MIDVTGINETVARLEELNRKVQTKILRKGLRAGAKLVAAKARASAPRRSGVMAAAVKVLGGGTKKGNIRVNVGARKKDMPAEAWYTPFVEFGHRFGGRVAKGQRIANATGRTLKGKGFLSDALESEQGRAIEAAAAVWSAEIDAAARGGS